MKLKKHILFGWLALAGAAAFTACDDLFRDTPVDKMSETDIWRNPMLLDEYVLPWYRNMHCGFSTYVPTTIALVKSASRYFMPWFGDQIVPSKTDYYNAGYGDLLKGNQQEITNWARVNWSSYYAQIQAINRMFDNQGEIADGDAQHELRAAQRKKGDRLIRPPHIGEEQDEQRLVARRDKDGEKRSERDVLPLVQLCRHNGEAAHGHKPRCTADERPDLARERAGGAPDAGIVLHQFDEDI